MKSLLLNGLKRYKKFSFWGKKIIPFYPWSFVLDHGCGTGAEISQIAPRHKGYLIGNDVDHEKLIVAKKLIRKCCKTCKNVDFVLADSTNLPFVGGCFDFVLSSFVLEHIRKREIALKEMHRVLKDEGCAIITLDTYLRCIMRCIIGYRKHLTFIVSSERRKQFAERLRSRAPKKDKYIIGSSFDLLEFVFNRLRRAIYILSYLVFPIKHGDYEHSVQEFCAYLPSSWVSLVEGAGSKKLEITFPSAKQSVGRCPGEMMIKAYKRVS
jgi:ubiquinone/menaquinone biosynthesis C-methylase UbiE